MPNRPVASARPDVASMEAHHRRLHAIRPTLNTMDNEHMKRRARYIAAHRRRHEHKAFDEAIETYKRVATVHSKIDQSEPYPGLADRLAANRRKAREREHARHVKEVAMMHQRVEYGIRQQKQAARERPALLMRRNAQGVVLQRADGRDRRRRASPRPSSSSPRRPSTAPSPRARQQQQRERPQWVGSTAAVPAPGDDAPAVVSSLQPRPLGPDGRPLDRAPTKARGSRALSADQRRARLRKRLVDTIVSQRLYRAEDLQGLFDYVERDVPEEHRELVREVVADLRQELDVDVDVDVV